MYLGEIVETGPIEGVFSAPQHPYTQALLKAIPQADLSHRRRTPPVIGELPSAYEPPSGCRFHTRCPVVMDGTCSREHPPLYDVGPAHLAACLWHDARFADDAPQQLALRRPVSDQAEVSGQ
jgi:oligopeptide/dipeptide ABC transporter ATP-binding protein